MIGTLQDRNSLLTQVQPIHEFVRAAVFTYGTNTLMFELVTAMGNYLLNSTDDQDEELLRITLTGVCGIAPVIKEYIGQLAFAVAEYGFIEYLSYFADRDLLARVGVLSELSH